MKKEAPTGKYPDAGYVFATIIMTDWKALIFWSLLIALPEIGLFLATDLPIWTTFSADLLQKIILIILLYRTGLKWAPVVLTIKDNWRPSISATLILGIAMQLLLYLPMLAIGASDSLGQYTLPAMLAAWSAALVIIYYFFFFFIPPILGVTSPREILQIAGSYFKTDRLLVARILIMAFAVELILSQIAGAIAPDERYLAISILKIYSKSLFWIAAITMGISAGLTFLEDQKYKELLPEYSIEDKEKRISEIRQSSQSWLAKLPTLSQSLKVLVVGLLLTFANYSRVLQTSPTPAFEVVETRVAGSHLIVNLKLSDPQFNFRGFQPRALALAGEERSSQSMISIGIDKIFINESPESLQTLTLLRTGALSSVNLELYFRTIKSGDKLKNLNGINLWYYAVKILPVEITPEEAPEMELPAPK